MSLTCEFSVRLVKTRGRHVGRCSCGGLEVSGPTEAAVRREFPIHLRLKGVLVGSR